MGPQGMSPLSNFPQHEAAELKYIFTDVDDTITSDGALLPQAYQAICDLGARGYKIVPVTGGPAGWCDCILRMWPVCAVVGESGAFYMFKDANNHQAQTRHLVAQTLRHQYSIDLTLLKQDILKSFPSIKLASDQFCRLYDLAIELFSIRGESQLMEIKVFLKNRGLNIKTSSIHLNAFWGEWDKLSSSKLMAQELWNIRLEDVNDQCLFIGDSLNDEPMFEFFNLSFGVANITDQLGKLKHKPKWITPSKGGLGFVEFSQAVLKLR